MLAIRIPLRWLALSLAALALAAIGLALAAPAAEAAETADGPRLVLKRRTETVVARGFDFPARRHIKVIFKERRNGNVHRATRRVAVNRRGRFVARKPLGRKTADQIILVARSGNLRVKTKGPKKPVATDTTTDTTTPTTDTTPPTTDTTTDTITSYGVDPTYLPVGDITVAVGDLSQRVLDDAPNGTRFVLAAGTHRLTAPLRPKPGQQLLGMPGAVISGAKVLSGWTAGSGHWYVTGQSQDLPRHPGWTPCYRDISTCNLTEDVWINDSLQREVTSLSEVGVGSYYFDRAADRIYIGTDPTGRRVETNVADGAIIGGAGVVVRNLVVEKFGNPGQRAAVIIDNGTVEHSEIRSNHGMGLQAYNGTVVRTSRFMRNGQFGISGAGANLLIENNEIAFNNTEGFDSWWAAGGTKFVYTDGLVVRGNWAHHNRGPGLWTDINNYQTRYEGNLVEQNEQPGIVHEISYEAVITGNVLRDNGSSPYRHWYVDDAAILVHNSSNVEVTRNTISGRSGVVALQDTRIAGSDNTRGDWTVKNLLVHGNDITTTDGLTGLQVYENVPSYRDWFTTKNNRFVNNTYRVPRLDGRSWHWLNEVGRDASRTWSEWLGFGQDSPGTVVLG